jgi:hypothetical protein
MPTNDYQPLVSHLECQPPPVSARCAEYRKLKGSCQRLVLNSWLPLRVH